MLSNLIKNYFQQKSYVYPMEDQFKEILALEKFLSEAMQQIKKQTDNFLQMHQLLEMVDLNKNLQEEIVAKYEYLAHISHFYINSKYRKLEQNIYVKDVIPYLQNIQIDLQNLKSLFKRYQRYYDQLMEIELEQSSDKTD